MTPIIHNMFTSAPPTHVDHQVHDGHVGGGHAQCHAVELALSKGEERGESVHMRERVRLRLRS